MRKLGLPLWIVTQEPETPNHPVAFTSVEPLIWYLVGLKSAEHRLRLVENQVGLILAVADFHQEGVTAVRLDPKPDGSAGQLIELAEVLAEA